MDLRHRGRLRLLHRALTRGFPYGESVWQWEAQRKHWEKIGGGQVEGRSAAIVAACSALVAAGIDLDQLPQDVDELAMFKERRARQQSFDDE